MRCLVNYAMRLQNVELNSGSYKLSYTYNREWDERGCERIVTRVTFRCTRPESIDKRHTYSAYYLLFSLAEHDWPLLNRAVLGTPSVPGCSISKSSLSGISNISLAYLESWTTLWPSRYSNRSFVCFCQTLGFCGSSSSRSRWSTSLARFSIS